MQKNALICLLWLVIAITSHNSFAADDLEKVYHDGDTPTSMVWPMLPNESLEELAAKFYPNNPAMQRKFILKTKQLSKARQQAVTASERSTSLKAVTIPNLNSLPASGGEIKPATKYQNEKPLRMSYDMLPAAEKAKLALKVLPEKMVKQYGDLIARNAFLKEELDKLNKRIIFLESKLGELKLMLDKTLTFPRSPKPIKNLDEVPQQAATASSPVKTVSAQQKSPDKTTISTAQHQTESDHFFRYDNRLLWLLLLGLTLLFVLFALAYNRSRARNNNSFVSVDSLQEQLIPEAQTEETEGDLELVSTTLNKETIVQEENDRSVLHEAKVLMSKGKSQDAIEHLKWAIRAKPKASIRTWLYLLEIYRQESMQDAFEKVAFEMHQEFNVMAPLWAEKEVAMVVPETLEEFPYIIQFLTEKWPNPKIITYLQKLITDNRNGERAGFSQSVIEEIVLLKEVLEIRAPEETNQETTSASH